MTGLADIARATAALRDMFPPGSPVVAMVSGGADSVALLRLLAAGELGEVRLKVLHVDHGLRAEASEADAVFVEALCAELRVPVEVVRCDVGAYAAAEGLNLEDAGRRVRYRLADERADALAAEAGEAPEAARIATAHTLDDRMETFVMRVLTGSGPGGLASIRHVRGRIVRPLLDARRADVVGYLRGMGQGWREDESNADTSRFRAQVRAEVLPVLEGANPSLDAVLTRTFDVLSEEDALLDGMARAFANEFAEASEHEVRLHRARMATLSRAMARRTVRVALADTFPEASRLEFEHVEGIVDGLADDRFARDLAGGLRAHCEYDRLIIARREGAGTTLVHALLAVPGSVDAGEGGTISAEPAGMDDIDDDPSTALIDAAKVGGALSVGPVLPGDRMRPLGMDGTRKVSDVLTDAKVPRRRRGLLPVVRDGDRVVWVAGVRMSDEYRVDPGTRTAVLLRWTAPAGKAADGKDA